MSSLLGHCQNIFQAKMAQLPPDRKIGLYTHNDDTLYLEYLQRSHKQVNI